MNVELNGIDTSEYQKGLAYINSIKYLVQTPRLLKAHVQGTARAPYHVHLIRDDQNEAIFGKCSCPAFDSNDQCKHVAAVILAQKGVFFENLNRYFFFESMDYADEYYYDEHDDYYDDHHFSRPSSKKTFTQLYQNFQWKLEVSKSPNQALENFYQEKQTSTNSLHLIWYYIRIQNVGRSTLISFTLQGQSLLKSGKLGKIKDVSINNRLIEVLPSQSDRNLLRRLAGHANWENNYYNTSNNFRSGEFPLTENKQLLIDIISSGRAFLLGKSIFDSSEDQPLEYCDHPVTLRLNIDSENKKITIEGELDNKVVNFQNLSNVEILDDCGPVRIENTFYPLAGFPCLDAAVLTVIRELNESNIKLKSKEWDKLKQLIVANVPHQIIGGDQFRLETIQLDLQLQIFLKWEEGTHFVRGLIHQIMPEQVTDKLIRYSTDKYNSLVNFLQQENIEIDHQERTFLFEAGLCYQLCQFFEENQIEVFLKKNRIKTAQNFAMQVNSDINWLEINPKLEFNSEDIDFNKALKQLDLSNNSVQLGNNTIGLLPEKWIGQIKKLQQHAILDKGQYILHPAKALLLEEISNSALPDQVQELKNNLQNFQKIRPLKSPKNFHGKLRPYQSLSLGWFEFLERCHFGGCLADDMGLGKTVQVIAWFGHKLLQDPNFKALIIAPKSLIFNWHEELEKFCPDLTTYRWESGNLSTEDFDQSNIVLVSYPLLQRQKEFKFEFDYLVLDEAQMIKNPKSLTHKAVAMVKAKHKLALTGTPVENHTGDLMSIFNIVTPGLFLSKNIQDPKSIENFGFIRPFILRRTKEEVLKDLPQKSIKTIFCEQSSREQKQYLTIHHALKNELQNADITNSKFNFLQILTKLRQAACHINLVDQTQKIESCKLETLKELVSEIHNAGHKLIIFSQFTKLLKLAMKELAMSDRNSCYLDGKTKDRQDVIERFKGNPDLQTFFISLKAGGVGLNLTNASYCIILDPWWNPAVESQAIDRIHRIGQKNPVFAYRLITKDTIEEKVALLQTKKRELYDKILKNNEGFIRDLTKNDIEFLLD